MNILVRFFCVLAVSFVMACGVPLHAESTTPEMLCLEPENRMQENHWFAELERYRHQPQTPQNKFAGLALEKVKIRYIMEALRRSELTFIRNGVAYSGQRAAGHLRWKHRLRGRRIRTAREFIDKIATRSSLTGKLYMARAPDGQTYPFSDIIYNELRRIEQYINGKHP